MGFLQHPSVELGLNSCSSRTFHQCMPLTATYVSLQSLFSLFSFFVLIRSVLITEYLQVHLFPNFMVSRGLLCVKARVVSKHL